MQPGKVPQNKHLICLSEMSPEAAAEKYRSPARESAGELRVLIGQAGRYVRHAHLLSQLTPEQGSAIVKCLCFHDKDFTDDDGLPVVMPDMPEMFSLPPYEWDTKKNRLATATTDDKTTHCIAYIFPESAKWKKFLNNRYDVSNYNKDGSVRAIVDAPKRAADPDDVPIAKVQAVAAPDQ